MTIVLYIALSDGRNNKRTRGMRAGGETRRSRGRITVTNNTLIFPLYTTKIKDDGTGVTCFETTRGGYPAVARAVFFCFFFFTFIFRTRENESRAKR